jgi:hypothetical protein
MVSSAPSTIAIPEETSQGIVTTNPDTVAISEDTLQGTVTTNYQEQCAIIEKSMKEIFSTYRENFNKVAIEMWDSEEALVITHEKDELIVYASDSSLPQKIERHFNSEQEIVKLMSAFNRLYALSIVCSGKQKDRIVKFSILADTLATKFVFCYANPDNTVHKSGNGGYEQIDDNWSLQMYPLL